MAIPILMRLNEKIYQAYLEELQALENFRSAHGELYGGVFQELAEDPFTKRLTEALAFFTARQSLQAENKVIHFYQRLFRQYFSFLATPLPAAGLTQIFPSLDLAEKISIPQGSEVFLNTTDSKQAYFQTLVPVEIFPIQLYKFHTNSYGDGTQIALEFRSSAFRKEQIGEFSLYLNHLSHFSSSLSFASALHQFLDKLEIQYGSFQKTESQRIPCAFSFGKPKSGKIFSHPLESLRFYLHFPEQDLFINIKIPPCEGKWQTFTLYFSIKEGWPKTIQFSKDSFVPFVIPIANLKKCFADSIYCDGTKDAYSILYPYPDDHFSLHSLFSVCEIFQNKMIPIRPGILTQEKGSYEIQSTLTKQMSVDHALILEFPDAITNHKLIAVEALWFQPWINYYLDKEIKPKMVQQRLSGLELRLIGKICPSDIPIAHFDIQFLIRILALKNQTSLDLNEFFFLADTLKKIEKSYFYEIPKIVDELKIYQEPHLFSSTHFSTKFHFRLEKWEEKNQELILLFFKCMKSFLDGWLSNSQVEIKLSSSKLKIPLHVKEGISS